MLRHLRRGGQGCFFLGPGLLQLVTFGGLGVWTLVDFIMIVTGNFKDGSGLAIKAT